MACMHNSFLKDIKTLLLLYDAKKKTSSVTLKKKSYQPNENDVQMIPRQINKIECNINE